MKAQAIKGVMCEGSHVTVFFPAQRLSNGEIVELPMEKRTGYLCHGDAIASAKRMLGI